MREGWSEWTGEDEEGEAGNELESDLGRSAQQLSREGRRLNSHQADLQNLRTEPRADLLILPYALYMLYCTSPSGAGVNGSDLPLALVHPPQPAC